MQPTRRDFVAAVGAFGGLYSLGLDAGVDPSRRQAAVISSPDAAPGGTTTAAPAWVDRPMRWAQLTLAENDPGTYDPVFWLDYFRRTKADAVCLSAGGCVAYYPTTVPFHHRSQWLGDRDAFGELVNGCRTLGMVVVARTDPHATYDDVQRAHPDWIHVTADGQPRRHWASPEMWVTCALGPYNFDFMTEVKREIATRYRPDAIFINRWDGSGQCFCVHCRTNFRAASGFDLPRTDDPQDPARRAYILWRQDRLFALWRLWDAEVRKINPDSCVIPNTGGGAGSALDMVRIGELAPTLVADHQARRGVTAPWANGKRGKEFRATMGRKPIVGIFSVGLEEPYRWKDSVQSPAEIRLWAIDGIANGLRPWYTKFAGSVNDPRWLKPVERLYDWCAANERYLRNERSLARVGLVYSQQSAWFARGERARAMGDAANGFYHALVEARIPFEMVHDRLLDAAHLAAFRTLVLPDVVALSDVFGVRFDGKAETQMHNAYLRLEHERAKGNALLAGLEDAPRIIHGVNRLDVTPSATFGPAPLTLIPSYPDLPMEKVYPRVPHTDVAQAFMREVGRGRVVYFPWDVDRTFWEILDADHGALLRNAVAWATNESPVVRVTGPGVLDVTAWRQARSATVHLVNLTNPMMMKGPVREPIAVGPHVVRVRLAGERAGAVRLLVAGTIVRPRRSGDWIEVTVPTVLEHEVVAIDL